MISMKRDKPHYPYVTHFGPRYSLGEMDVNHSSSSQNLIANYDFPPMIGCPTFH